MGFTVSPGANVTLPEGKAPPRSPESAGDAPDPVTAQSTETDSPWASLIITLNEKGVVPEFPSALSASTATALNFRPLGRTVPVS